MERPKLKTDIDLSSLKALTEDYLNFVESDDFNEDEQGDYEQAIHEKMMVLFYGEEVFDFINEKMV